MGLIKPTGLIFPIPALIANSCGANKNGVKRRPLTSKNEVSTCMWEPKVCRSTSNVWSSFRHSWKKWIIWTPSNMNSSLLPYLVNQINTIWTVRVKSNIVPRQLPCQDFCICSRMFSPISSLNPPEQVWGGGRVLGERKKEGGNSIVQAKILALMGFISRIPPRCNTIHIYFEVSAIESNESYLQESVYRVSV